MHEYSIVQALVDRIDWEVAGRGGVAVRRVTVRIGTSSGVDAALLATAFDLVRDGTICDGAALEIVAVEPEWACSECCAEISAGEALTCRRCGSPAALTRGDEILLERIEMERPAGSRAMKVEG